MIGCDDRLMSAKYLLSQVETSTQTSDDGEQRLRTKTDIDRASSRPQLAVRIVHRRLTDDAVFVHRLR